jgi:thioredoxin 1
MAEHVVTVDVNNYKKEVLEAKEPVLLDVWAAWCGPCRMVSPIVEQIAAENLGKIKVAKLNSDENMALAVELGVMSLPTLILFKGGKEATRLMGAMPKPAIMARLDPYL